MDRARDQNGVAARRAKWGSNSKFNRILNNLERSILNQFNSNTHNKKSNESSSCSNTSTANISKKKAPQPHVTTSQSASSPKKDFLRTIGQQSKRPHDEQQVQKTQTSVNNDDKIALQLKDKVNSTKTATNLNKYQQKIVSTMRPNQLIITNKLSIPPPHSNDEARHQSHRLLFNGAPIATNESFETSRAPHITNPTEVSTKSALGTKLDDTIKLGSSSSPASSARSLPSRTTNSQPGSQTNENQTHNDEDSGFSTYQSKRSLANNPVTTTTNAFKFTQPTSGEHNNMILVPSTHFPLGIAHQNYATHSNQPRQNYLYAYQNSHNSHLINAPQLVNCNQVPILCNNAFANNCYSNNNNLQHQTISPHLRLNQISDQTNQIYVLCGQNTTILPVVTSDAGQQIYANAPPKPRRYQYYDFSNQTLIPNQIINPNATSSTITTAPMTNSNFSYVHRPMQGTQGFVVLNNQHQFKQSQQAQFQHMQPQIYNMPTQLSSSYQRFPANLQQQNNISAYIQPQQVNPQLQLTKSKSSLDVFDLSRFRQDKIAERNTELQQLRYSVQQQESQKQQQQQLYGSHIDSGVLVPKSIAQPIGLLQSNLQRSKSVTHLLADQDTQQLTKYQETPYYQNNRHIPLSVLKPYSSASTTELNYLGLSDVDNSRGQSANQRGQTTASRLQVIQNSVQHTQFNDPGLQPGNQLFSSLALRQHQQKMNNWNRQNHNDNNQSQQHKVDLTKFNSTPANNGKLLRQTAADSFVAREENLSKLSLDDQIRCLLIENDSNDLSNRNRDCRNDRPTNHHHVDTYANGTQSSSLLAKSGLPTDGGRNTISRKAPQSSVVETRTSSNQNSTDLDLRKPPTTNDSNLTMGNRQHRQYQVTGNITKALESPRLNNLSDSSSNNSAVQHEANSQLIVDLTTPRVLAKTQTTLTSTKPETNNIFCSFNQVGLPQVMNPSKNSDANCSTSTNDHEQAVKQESAKAAENSAPYYYSDLKSEEQRRALLTIVQQKSLSPPPQLLSRSNDQSNTRLSLKSATLHPGHARMLSQNLIDRAAALNQKTLQSKEFSSTSNISKNIDKLFDSPQSQILTSPTKSKLSGAQSMLSLHNCGSDGLGPSRDEDDFIEFMSTDGSSHRSSQFEASQFSVSDFNTSSASTSDSSSSETCNDSLSSPIKQNTVIKHHFANGAMAKFSSNKSTGILKDVKNENLNIRNGSSNNNNNNNSVDDIFQNGDNQKAESEIKGVTDVEDKDNFNNILGNVVDVDICPLNNLSQYSPVNN